MFSILLSALNVKEKLLVIVVAKVVSKYNRTSRLNDSFVNKQFNILTNRLVV